MGAALNRGKSKQDYGTPPEFIAAVEKRFGPLCIDLAASHANTKAPRFFSKENDSLSLPWFKTDGLCWLNPPFANIAPWAAKCRVEAAEGVRILMLVPASVGSNWFAEHVHRHALVLALSPRIKFVGAKDPYPKDCVLACYNFGVGFDVWRWA